MGGGADRMIRFECDKCGAKLSPNDAERFIIKIEAYAAAGPMAFSEHDLEKDRSDEIRSLIDKLDQADPDEIEDQTYRAMRFDLCAGCHREFLTNPIR